MAKVLLLLLWIPNLLSAQGFYLTEGRQSQRIKFELINNLIIIPIEVNGAKLSFILDSGVSNPLLFNLGDQDSIQLKNVSEITIAGLGQGAPIKALSSLGNFFKLKHIESQDQLLYVVLDRDMNFSPTLGIPIHGIIGYDLFKNFVVDINYMSQVIHFYEPVSYKEKPARNSQTLPLTLHRKKAFLDGVVEMRNKEEIAVKLLVDTGSSDAIWLFQNPEKGLMPEKHYDDFLGKGLNGKIFGKRTMIEGIRIGNFELREAKAAFPDLRSFSAIKNLGNRNGSVGGEILKRFNIVFNYPAGEITLRKNGNFSAPYHFNMSGIELQHNGLRYIAERIADTRGVVQSDQKSFGDVEILREQRTRLSLVPEIIVSAIRAGSPAEEAGLQEGDVILAVNGKRIHRYKLQEVMKMINEGEGKHIRILIERYNRDLTFSFVLKKLFK